MTKITIVFDDTSIAEPSVHDLFGVVHYGALMFQRRRRSDAMAEIAAKANAKFVHIQDPQDRLKLIDSLQRQEQEDDVFLRVPAYLAATGSQERLITALRQMAYAPGQLLFPQDTHARDGWCLINGALLQALLQKTINDETSEFLDAHGSELVEVSNRINLADLRDERTLLDYLSGQMDARHFNSVHRDDYTITKRSTDREKLKREFDFHSMVPPNMRMFLIPPFGFEDNGETASYQMERLSIPDMAMQWVHGAFQPHEFDRFLRHIFYFLKSRATKRASKTDAVQVQDALYLEKVRQRIADLKAMPSYNELASYFERAFGGIDSLLQRYEKQFLKMRTQIPKNELAIGHGDPCFSNILYSKTNQYLKLIDPRGAGNEDELFTDPLYDVAKLSHSVLGRYDFINQGDFELQISADLKPALKFDAPYEDWVRTLFVEHIEAAGYSMPIVRLCEASLFISMLPLHIDRPKKVLGFAIRGHEILNELTQA